MYLHISVYTPLYKFLHPYRFTMDKMSYKENLSHDQK